MWTIVSISWKIGISKMINLISKSCEVCQKKKLTHLKKKSGVPLVILETYSNWFFLVLLFALEMVIDQFAKYAEAFALPNATGDFTAKVLEDEIFLRNGVPDEFFSDSGLLYT